jgi:hypothetical protein
MKKVKEFHSIPIFFNRLGEITEHKQNREIEKKGSLASLASLASFISSGQHYWEFPKHG